jgi:hypothetical protein
MTCPDFLSRFSEFYDGDPSLENRQAFEAHLESCRSCRRYHEVVVRGVELLRSLPRPEPREDFRPRLQHAIYHVDEERWRRRRSQSVPGTGAMTLVAAVGILAAILWTPVLFDEAPSVELPPGGGNTPGAPANPSSVSSPARPAEPASFLDSNLWAQPNSLLFEYTTLYRARGSGVVRTGLQ